MFVAAAGAAGLAEAQPGGDDRRTAAYVQAGAASERSETGALVGARLARELTRFLSIEAGLMHLDRGPGATGFEAEASLMLGVRPSGRRVVPYLALGGGLYRASFELSHARFDPRGQPGSPVVQPGPAPGTGVLVWVDGVLPEFYADRLAETVTAQAPLSGTRSFTDPALTFGGGVRVGLGRRGFLRPDARALRVSHDGAAQTFGVFTLQLGYRF